MKWFALFEAVSMDEWANVGPDWERIGGWPFEICIISGMNLGKTSWGEMGEFLGFEKKETNSHEIQSGYKEKTCFKIKQFVSFCTKRIANKHTLFSPKCKLGYVLSISWGIT